MVFFFLRIRRPPKSPLFPYTPLSRSPVNRHVLKVHGYDAGVHVAMSPVDPEVVQIRFYEPPGIQLTPKLQKEIEKHFSRGELRRMAYNEVGAISYPARVRESYAEDLLATLDCDAIRERGFRIVVDYGYSAASFVLPSRLRSEVRRVG